jgi:hypothetical protein
MKSEYFEEELFSRMGNGHNLAKDDFQFQNAASGPDGSSVPIRCYNLSVIIRGAIHPRGLIGQAFIRSAGKGFNSAFRSPYSASPNHLA